MGWRGILAGVFGLIVLQVLVANQNASGAVGGLALGFGGLVNSFLDPTKPAIPQRATTSAATSGSSANTAAAVTPQQAVNAVPTPGGTGTGYNPNSLA